MLRITLLVLWACSCGDPPPSDYPTKPVTLKNTTLGPGDTFEVRVYKHEKLSGMYRVAEDGTISFPYLKSVQVNGLTPDKVEDMLREGLADGYLVDPFVSVLVKEYASKKVSVFGYVKEPGTLPFSEGMTIVEAISKAGGFTRRAHQNAITVTRNEGKKKEKYTIPVESIGKGRADNFYMAPGDVVYVPKKAWH